MEKRIIHLTTREQLNVYMSPVRQELLRQLRLAQGPQTAKALSDKLKISPSSVQVGCFVTVPSSQLCSAVVLS